VEIPAGTLEPNTVYESTIGFYRATFTSNTTYTTTAFRASTTQFMLRTTGTGTLALPLLTNAVWSSSSFSFDVVFTAGERVSVEYSSGSAGGPWKPLVSTNSLAGRVRIIDGSIAPDQSRVYRARSGL
jgi:hypothetical protein